MSLTFRAHADQGEPLFYDDPDEGLLGVQIARGARGRWLADWSGAAAPGQSLVLSGALRTALAAGEAEVVVVFWRDEPGWILHSTRRAFALSGQQEGFTPFASSFAVPEGVKGLRVDVRAWTGSGVVEARGLALRVDESGPQDEDPFDGLPLPEVPAWPLRKVAGYQWGDNFYLTLLADEAGANGRG